ncbi:MAG TPA: serine/threonine-protein kinase [Vicinamibacterales bacterium]|jgi:non-specific serine/threonine protein kinase/serine/threonine-protein kinase
MIPPSPRRQTDLSPSDLLEVEAIFSDMSELQPSARGGVLDLRCAGREGIRRELQALLDAHDRLAGFLESPVAAYCEYGAKTGDTIGAYRIVDRIGHGGMGDVFLAERVDGTFEQRVAIKLTRASVRDPESARRFRFERQILASLQYPNIVTLLDGGATPQGDAYLVMEYVAGEPITDYCRRQALGLPARIALLRQVCRAVQHAHQHSIVHRDLKPANILVTDGGVVKVLDFGVAKLLQASNGTSETLTGMMPGPLTPNYASPEQLRGLPVTTACDVYSLGVLAYEVLAGARPYDTTGKPLDQVLAIVLATQPARPSTMGHGGLATGGAAPVYSPGILKGDLDAIVLKAISKEPLRRYGSAGELADDLERYLTKEPVLAREPSLGYLLQRVCARNRALVATAALSMLAIVAALSVAVWQRSVAVTAQARAESRFRDVRHLANALIFKIHDAVAPLPGSTPVRQTIVKEAIGYLEGLERDSARDESLQLELSGAYRQIAGILGDPQRANLGDREGAIQQLERARALALPLARRSDAGFEAVAAFVNSNRQLAMILNLTGQSGRSLELVQEAQTISENAYARRGDPRVRHLLASVLFDHALALLQRDGPASLEYWQKAGAIYETELAEQPDAADRQRNVALVEKYVGGRDEDRGDFHEAARHYDRALDLDLRREAKNGTDRVIRFDVAVDYSNLANMADSDGDLAKAEDLFATSLRIREELAASDPRDALSQLKVGTGAWRLGRVQRHRGRFAEARVSLSRALQVLDAAMRVSNDRAARGEMASALFEMGRLDAAIGKRAAACDDARRAAGLAALQPPLTRYLPGLVTGIEADVAACGSGGPPIAR